MRHRILFAAIVLSALTGLHPGAVRASVGRPLRIAFVAPLEGPLGSRVAEIRAGVESAARYWSGRASIGKRAVEVVAIDSSVGFRAAEKALAKLKPVAMVAATGGEGAALPAALARKRKIPCIVVTIWAPPFEADARDPVFHLAGSQVDHAIAAVAACRIPLGAGRAAAIHDASAGSKALAEAFVRNLSPDVSSGGAHVLAGDGDATKILAGLAADGVDVAFVCADVPGAVRLAEAASARSSPRLLYADGLLGEDLARVASDEARFLCGITPDIDDGVPSRYRIGRRDRDLPPSPMGVRGYGAVCLIMEGLIHAKLNSRGLVTGLRALDHPKRGGASRFREWGQSRLFTYHLFEMTAEGPAPIKRAYLPSKPGGELLGQRPASRFVADPETKIVRVTYGTDGKRTIEDDLRKIGLFTRGYEAELDGRIEDEVMSRAIQWLNRHFWRNVDGTPIPNVSFKITFTAAPPEEVPGRNHWIVRMAGDDPSAGGRAANPYALVFSSFIVRTMYLSRALDPVIRRKDLDYFTRGYAWGTTAEENIRNDEIRSLLDGLAGALGLTGAHELGHLAGLGHDTASPRSIMNVAEGGGLEPAWAEWVPAHRKTFESRLKRSEAKRGGRRR